MSLRLNKSDKEYIANKARQLSPLNNQLKELLEAREKIALEVRIEALGGATQAAVYDSYLEQAYAMREALPDDIRTYSLGINHSNKIVVRLLGNQRMRLYFSKNMVVPQTAINITQQHTCYKALSESIETEETIYKQLRELKETVYASIASITTVKKLLESWDEAKELLPPHLLLPKAQLPALQTTKLNKLIGLPTKKGTK